MSHRHVISSFAAKFFALVLVFGVGLVGAYALRPTHADDVKPEKPTAQPLSSALTAAPNPDPAKPVATIGKDETARWTPTTIEAAASEKNKMVLASGKKKTVTGEIVDVSCYLQLGKRGDAHIPCGTKCLNNGEPIGLVDEEDTLYILFPEEHHPRRDGEVTLKSLIPLLGKFVTVTGMETDMGYHALFIQGSELAKVSNTPAPVKSSKPATSK